MSMYRKVFAFVRRGYITETSYKISFVFQFAAIFMSVFTFYFLSRLVGESGEEFLRPYASDYFTFALTGVAFLSFSETALKSYSEKLRREQLIGSLEALFATPTKVIAILLSSSIWEFFMAGVRSALFIGVGMVIFGVRFDNANMPVVLLVFLLGLACFLGAGILSAAFIVLFKRGSPLTLVFGSLSAFLSGVFYPVAVLPPWLQVASHFLPLTYFLEAMRLSLLQGYGVMALGWNIIILGLFALVLLLGSLVTFSLAIKRAKSTGALLYY